MGGVRSLVSPTPSASCSPLAGLAVVFPALTLLVVSRCAAAAAALARSPNDFNFLCHFALRHTDPPAQQQAAEPTDRPTGDARTCSLTRPSSATAPCR